MLHGRGKAAVTETEQPARAAQFITVPYGGLRAPKNWHTVLYAFGKIIKNRYNCNRFFFFTIYCQLLNTGGFGIFWTFSICPGRPVPFSTCKKKKYIVKGTTFNLHSSFRPLAATFFAHCTSLQFITVESTHVMFVIVQSFWFYHPNLDAFSTF